MLLRRLLACTLLLSGITFAARRTGGYVPVTTLQPDYPTSGTPAPMKADVSFSQTQNAPANTNVVFVFWTVPILNSGGVSSFDRTGAGTFHTVLGSSATTATSTTNPIPGLKNYNLVSNYGVFDPNKNPNGWTNSDSCRYNSRLLPTTAGTPISTVAFSLPLQNSNGPADFMFYYEIKVQDTVTGHVGTIIDSGSKIVHLHP